MTLRLIADANAQTTIALALGSGAASFVGGNTANFTSPQSFGNGQGSLTILDAGNPAFNQAAPFATPFEYAYYTNNNTGTNTISGLTRGVAGTTPHNFFAGAQVAQGLIAEDIIASVPWKFDEQSPIGASLTIPASGSIPASYLGITWRHIQIRWVARDTSGNNSDVLSMQFNGDNTANYDNQVLDVTGTAATPAQGLTATSARVGIVPGAGTGAAILASGRIEINNYAATATRRYVESRCVRNEAGITFGYEDGVCGWRNSSSAITSITLFPGAGSFGSGSLFTTYLIP